MVTARSSASTVIFTGGGTGGHVYPLIAVARALEQRARVRCLFVGTDRGLETRAVPAAGFPLELLPVLPVRGRGARGAVKGVASVLRCARRVRALFEEHSPVGVFSLGGYAAAPVALTAKLLGVSLCVMEPNSVPGYANRAVALWADRVYTAFAETQRYFRAKTVRRYGVALRAGFEPQSPRPQVSGQKARVLVLGGSQGALTLNEKVPRALSQMGVTVEVHHQAGRGRGDSVESLYRELQVGDFRVSEFIDDMPAELAWADLVISRAGAGALAEIGAVGRPAILVPLASSAGDHQLLNALALERAGAAVCLRPGQDTAQRLCSVMEELLLDSACLTRMAESARKWGQPGAAHRVAQDLASLWKLDAGDSAVWSAQAQGEV